MSFIRFYFCIKLLTFFVSFVFVESVLSVKPTNLEVIAMPTIDESSQKGMYVVWYLKSPNPLSITEYQIYRDNIKVSTLSTKVNLKSLIKKLKKDGIYPLYKTLFSLGKDVSFEKSWLQLQFTAMTLSRFNRDLLPFLQTSFVDSKPATSSIVYRVEAYAGKELIASGVSSKVASSQQIKLKSPENIRVSKKKEHFEIHFSIPSTPVAYIQGISYSFEKHEDNFAKRKKKIFLIQEATCTASKITSCMFKIPLNIFADFKEKELFFDVTVVFQDGRLSPASEPKKINIFYVSKLTGPEVEKVIQKERALIGEIVWKPLKEKDVSHYLVYRSYHKEKDYKIIHTIPIPKEGNSYIDRTITRPGKLHWYKVRGVSKKRGEGLFSQPVPFLPKNYVKPRIVQIEEVVPKIGGIELTFQKLKRKDIYQYRLYERTGHSGHFSLIQTLGASVKVPTFIIKKLDSRNSYCYVIRALDVFSNISESQKPECRRPLNATPVASPSTLTTIFDRGGVTLKWTANNNTFSAGFYIFRKQESSKTFTRISKKLLLTDRIYTDKDIKRGNKYTYYMVSVAKGEIFSRPSIKSSISIPIRKLEPIQNLKIYRKKSNVILEWFYLSDVKMYHVYMKPVFYTKEIKSDKKNQLHEPKLLGKTLKKSFTFPAPKRSGKYEFFVAAIDGSRVSPIKEKRYLTIE